MSGAIESGGGAEAVTVEDHYVFDPESIETRLRIRTSNVESARGVVTMSMRVPDFSMTDEKRPMVGTVAVLGDVVGGLVNHIARPADTWTVTSELSMDIGGVVAAGDEVVGSTELLTADAGGALSLTRFRVGERCVGVATVRSFFLPAASVAIDYDARPERAPVPEATSTEELLAIQRVAGAKDGEVVLAAQPDSVVGNAMGFVHGGVVAAAIECAALGALEAGGAAPMSVGSIRVNYLRPFIAGDGACYRARAERIGRSVASVVANAVGADGAIAASARVTAYA